MITILSKSNILISNIYSGIKLDENTLKHTDLPNRSPESCAFRIETDSDTNILYDSKITFENENDKNNSGEYNIIGCNINAFEMCLGVDHYGKTMYGKYFEKCKDSIGHDSSLHGDSKSNSDIINNNRENVDNNFNNSGSSCIWSFMDKIW